MTNMGNTTDTIAAAPTEERYSGIRVLRALRWALPLASVLLGVGVLFVFYFVPPFREPTPALFALRVGIFVFAIPTAVAVLTNWAIRRGDALLAVERRGRQGAEERLRQEERFRHLLESMNDGYVIVQDKRWLSSTPRRPSWRTTNWGNCWADIT